MVRWDRGFDAAGAQVRGAVKSGCPVAPVAEPEPAAAPPVD